MKTYDVIHCGGKPDWSAVPVVQLDEHLWSDVRSIIPQAQAAWDEDALYVRLTVTEPNISRQHTGPLAPVYQDSCLEFFFSPQSNDRYFNFEFNPNGAFYAGFGKPDIMRYRLQEEYLPETLQVTPFELPGGWGVEFVIPVSFVQIFVPDFHLFSGRTLRANFYKCGDKTVQPHYIAWNPIEYFKPCFHLPQFFGTLYLK